MRVVAVSSRGILDSLTGEVTPTLEIEKLLIAEPGGIIAGNNLYPILASLDPEIKRDEGWTMAINMQQQRTNPMLRSETRLTGKMYVSRLTYRRAKIGTRRNRRRPPAIKWLVLELGLFLEKPPLELEEILTAARSLTRLADRRGIKPRPSPGSFGSAMLRASSEWDRSRRPAPSFISEVAREHLPGNFYAIANKMKGKRLDHAYYLDQESSHHKIASSIPLPHPHSIRARGYFRAAENNSYRQWARSYADISGYVGLTLCMVQCGHIPREQEHLYPPWALQRGTKPRWIWTPEFRLIENDYRIQVDYVICALASPHIDTALWEYAEWALEQRKRDDAATYKSALLASYGMLGIRADRPIQLFTVHGRPKGPRQSVVELPLLPRVYRSEVRRTRTPAVQNVIARGVIEAETRTRSLEYARQLESEGTPVAQVYADGVLAATDQMPLILPQHWRIMAALTRVYAPHPNSIISDQLVRLPGILGSAKAAYSTAWEPEPVRNRLEAIPANL